MSHDSTDARHASDRRRRATPLLNRYFFWGQRRTPRRAEEMGPCYVDRPGSAWILGSLLILVLGIVDAWLTHSALDRAVASEGNPLMSWFLETIGFGWTWFFKILVTAIGCWLLLAHQRWEAAKFGLIALAGYYLGVLMVHLQLYF